MMMGGNINRQSTENFQSSDKEKTLTASVSSLNAHSILLHNRPDLKVHFLPHKRVILDSSPPLIISLKFIPKHKKSFAE